MEGGGFKLTAPKKEGVDTKLLKAEVELVCADLGRRVPETETGQTSTDGDFLDEIKGGSAVLTEYRLRKEYEKVLTTELPRMCRD